jgi:hypothetical protein
MLPVIKETKYKKVKKLQQLKKMKMMMMMMKNVQHPHQLHTDKNQMRCLVPPKLNKIRYSIPG